jgi:hypothetical protein
MLEETSRSATSKYEKKTTHRARRQEVLAVISFAPVVLHTDDENKSVLISVSIQRDNLCVRVFDRVPRKQQEKDIILHL